jgi:hypothetical protein
MIVGVLTESNQFVLVSDPIPSSLVVDELRNLQSGNYLLADRSTLNAETGNVDKQRVDYIENIRGESKNYQMFRTQIRQRMNQYTHLVVRKKIEGLLENKKILYQERSKEMVKQLRMLGIAFGESLNRRNLLSGKDNEQEYYLRIADELIRYPLVRAFVLEPEKYLILGDIPYDVLDSEMLVPQSLLVPEFFDRLVPSVPNPYVNTHIYDIASPIRSYDNKIRIRKNNKQIVLI